MHKSICSEAVRIQIDEEGSNLEFVFDLVNLYILDTFGQEKNESSLIEH